MKTLYIKVHENDKGTYILDQEVFTQDGASATIVKVDKEKIAKTVTKYINQFLKEEHIK